MTKCILFLIKTFQNCNAVFREGFRAEQCLVHVIEKWRIYIDFGGHGSALLADLSKSFDCIDHLLLITKRNGYGVDTNLLYFLASYLKKTKQKTKVNGSYSNFENIFRSVQQGFILGPLLFNIYNCDLFFRIGDLGIASYAYDNMPCSFSSELDMVMKNLRSYTIKFFQWFHDNRLTSNAGKYNLTTSSTSPVEIQIGNTIISSVKRVKLIGVHIDGRIVFDYHVNQICKKVSKKIYTLFRVFKYMDQNIRRMIMKA